MATFSFIKCCGYAKPHCLAVTRADDEEDGFSVYINNEQIVEFGEAKSGDNSYITMTNGTTYYIHKSLADLMNEFGKIQYTV